MPVAIAVLALAAAAATASEPGAGDSLRRASAEESKLLRGGGLKLRRAYRAIEDELRYQAAARQSIDGDPFSWSYDDCSWLSRSALKCLAWIFEYMPQECAFAGRNATYSAEEAWVIARRVGRSRAVDTRFGYTYNHFYCFG